MGLKASDRIKKRYILLNCKEDDVKKAILDYIGILGWAKATPVFVKAKKGTILSVDRQELDNVLAAFSAQGKIKVESVSGTIDGLD